MKLHELFSDPVEEGIAKWAGLAGLGAAAMFGQPSKMGSETLPSIAQSQPAQTSSPVQKTPAVGVTKSAAPAAVKPSISTAQRADARKQNLVRTLAARSGLKGNELAAFLAQTATETLGFRAMEELGTDEYIKGLYDKEGNNPAKAVELGNVNAGDGVRYKGRGLIQLTGRDNYRRVGDALKLPLEAHPEMAARPDIAMRVALWFWKNRVKPSVTNWNDVASVTHKINRGLHRLEDRQANYDYYQKLLAPKPTQKPKQKT